MKKYLVTGGDGFIGSAVCSMLANSGFKVTSLDNRYRKRKFINSSKFKSIKCDITNLSNLLNIREKFVFRFRCFHHIR